MRNMLWNLAYRLLSKNEWKKLAEHWVFTEEQIAAIEEQWTGEETIYLVLLNAVIMYIQICTA